MNLKELPSVDRLLTKNPGLIQAYGRDLTLMSFRTVLDGIRHHPETDHRPPTFEQIVQQAQDLLGQWVKPTLFPVINATGVVLHTNLGRAPISESAVLAMSAVGRGYSNLEFDLGSGKRGSRSVHVGALLTKISGAEDAYVVNNCASALLLVLSALAKGKQVIIPRSQLVEIGGGFRIPDVMRQSGAKLLEVGTTNKVRLADFEDCFEGSSNPSRKVLLRAHRSNFKMVGFTEEPELGDLCGLAHRLGTILIDDLGSGAVLDTAKFGMDHEPMVQESILAGADLVLFSGDKLIGGPQAGIIVGRKSLIEVIKKHPLARAVRADKTCLAGLAATILHYLKGEAELHIPIWKIISQNVEMIRARTESLQERLGTGEVIGGFSTVGGGSLPGEVLPTFLLSLRLPGSQAKLKRMREAMHPVIARVEDDQILIDMRTVFDEDFEFLVKTIKIIL